MSSNNLTISMIGNAHLDPAWMWQWGEGMEAFIATCRSALDRMCETPELVFTCSSAAHYRWVEEHDPEMFEEIRSRVQEGRWEIVGGWWTQADCNLPSGEGFVRQALLGQRYFMEKFGRSARTGYSPDAFGHNRGLPQLLADADMNGYIFCRPDPAELTLPSPLFHWLGPDGSRVLGYRVPFHYNMYQTSVPKKVADLVEAFDNASDLTTNTNGLTALGNQWALFYGIGNHGGGPTRKHIQQIQSLDADPNQPSLRFARLDDFLDAVRDQPNIPEWNDDLQLNAPGCYSTHSQIKLLNRRSEYLLAAAERFSSLGTMLLGIAYPADELRAAWANVCFNHFHDILCGVAIREALDDAVEMYGAALATAKRTTRHALQQITRTMDTTGDGQTLVVFNSHSFDIDRSVTFELWHDIDKTLWSQPVDLRITDDAGNDLVCQLEFPSGKIGRDRIAATFRAQVPALGWTCYRVYYGERSTAVTTEPPIRATNTTLENNHVRIEFSAQHGTISSWFDKHTGRELFQGEAARAIAIDDPTDSWGHGVERFDDGTGEFDEAEVHLVENGTTHATIRSRSYWSNSWIQQDFRLYAHDNQLHVSVKVFWAEQNVMLKLEFPANVAMPRAHYEGAYCSVEKPCDGIERPGGAWTALMGHIGSDSSTHAGLAIINNAKYGYSANDSALMITVLRSPAYALHDPHPIHPDEDLDFIDQGVQRFRYVIVPINGKLDQSHLYHESAVLNAPPIAQFESAHPAPLTNPQPRTYRGIEVTPDNVIATVVKQNETLDGWIIRLFETNGIHTDANVVLSPTNTPWNIALKPFQVRTLWFKDGVVKEVNLNEQERMNNGEEWNAEWF